MLNGTSHTVIRCVVVAALSQLACGDPTVETTATNLAFSVQPTTTTMGDMVTPHVAVSVRDAAGITFTDASASVTLAIGTNPGGGTLSGTMTVPAIEGTATFTDLAIDAAGVGYTLEASATGLNGATSNPFDIDVPANATRVLLTDDPFPYDRIARVDIYFVSVSGSLAPDTSSGGTFVTLATPNRSIDLLALQGGVTDQLNSLVLPEGIITAIRVVIDTDSSSITLKDGRVLTSTSSPGIAWQSSAGRPVLNALIHEHISVPDSGGVVAIIYDVGNAFIPPQVIDPTSTDSGFIFSPVLRAADATRTGSITGAVEDSSTSQPIADASLRLYLGNPTWPENTWMTLATARTDQNGAFHFAFVTPSDHWKQFPSRADDVYVVAVDPPMGTGLGRSLVVDVRVVAATITDVGTIALP